MSVNTTKSALKEQLVFVDISSDGQTTTTGGGNNGDTRAKLGQLCNPTPASAPPSAAVVTTVDPALRRAHQGPPPLNVRYTEHGSGALAKPVSAMQRFYYGRNVTGFLPKQPNTVAVDMKEQVKEAEDIIRMRDAPPVLVPSKAQVAAALKRKEKGGEATPPSDTQGTTDAKEEEGKEKKIRVVPHRVEMDDTYARLALRYHTTAKVIKKWNQIRKPLKYMIGRILEIPAGQTYVATVADPSNRAVVLQNLAREFVRMTKGKCERMRADYYLKNNDLDIKKALAEWREDDAWEQQQTTGPLAEMLIKEYTEKEQQTKTQANPQKQTQDKETTKGIELATVAVSTII